MPASVSVPSRYEMRRPQVSATTPVGTLEEDHAGREERVRRERLEVAQPRVEQEERVDPPDERGRERVAEHQRQVGPLDAAG